MITLVEMLRDPAHCNDPHLNRQAANQIERVPGTGDRKQQGRLYDQAHDTQLWRRWYKTAQWQRTAKAQLDHEPLCRMCRVADRLTPATLCDHIKQHRGDPVRLWTDPFQLDASNYLAFSAGI